MEINSYHPRIGCFGTAMKAESKVQAFVLEHVEKYKAAYSERRSDDNHDYLYNGESEDFKRLIHSLTTLSTCIYIFPRGKISRYGFKIIETRFSPIGHFS
jgi:hypothetical protein